MPQMPDLRQALLMRAKPDPNVEPQWTPEGEGLPTPLILRASNALLGAAGLGGLVGDDKDTRLGELLGTLLPMAKAAAIPGAVAVAAGGPSNIPKLKAAGKALIEKLTAEGLEPRWGGINPNTTMAASIKTGAMEPIENATLNPDTLKALQFAQEKYPRLFGHIADVTDLDKADYMRQARLPEGSFVRGTQRSVSTYNGYMQGLSDAEKLKMSEIGLNPHLATPQTVGHELLHAADQLTMPRTFTKNYESTLKLPTVTTAEGTRITPYEGSSYEVRARNAGEALVEKMQRAGLLPQRTPQDVSLDPVRDKFKAMFDSPEFANFGTMSSHEPKGDMLMSSGAIAARKAGEERIAKEGLKYLKPKEPYATVIHQPKPGGVLDEVLSRAGFKSGTGEELTPGEARLLKHYSGLIR